MSDSLENDLSTSVALSGKKDQITSEGSVGRNISMFNIIVPLYKGASIPCLIIIQRKPAFGNHRSRLISSVCKFTQILPGSCTRASAAIIKTEPMTPSMAGTGLRLFADKYPTIINFILR